MAKVFNPSDWYWIVGGDGTRVFSSARGDYFAASDATYAAWAADGTVPTSIGSEAELGDVLAPYSIRPTAANVLDGYQDSQSKSLNIQTVAKVMFFLTNQVRSLQGQTALSAAQFRALIKGLM